jgi:hypothetical protein
MYSTMLTLLQEVRFHELLLKFDQDLAEQVRAGRCGTCGATLHAGHYARKPRGGLPQLGDEHRERFSWCCSREGCRDRATPPSVRFLGPKVYLGAVVVLISAMRCGANPTRMRELHERIGVSRRTAERWRLWWRTVFAQSPFWRAAADQFKCPVATTDLPHSLVERFTGAAEAALLSLLRFLTPITTGAGVRAM